MTSDADDKALMLRFQDTGDFAAFEQLFLRHKDGLIGFLLRLSGSETVAEDISQQIWLKLIELAGQGGYTARKAASFRTFLFTMGRNRYFDEYHRSHASTRTESLEGREGLANGGADASAADPVEMVSDAQAGTLIDRAMALLPAEQREVVALWSLGVDLKTVSEITGVSWHTVVSRKKYAVSKLRAALNGHELL